MIIKSHFLPFPSYFCQNNIAMKICEIISALEEAAPLWLQESYDNAGLTVGNPDADVDSALITLDVTDAVLDEAIREGCGIIISHHPVIFNGLKELTGSDFVQRVVIKAIRHDIALYAIHTNLDNAANGVNRILADKIGLVNTKILKPAREMLKKLVSFSPVDHAEKVRKALFEAGAGHIGNYDCCSFSTAGTGSFRGNEQARPFAGKPGKLHFEDEIRIETIFPVYRQQAVISALLQAHPYEEVAYDIYALDNVYDQVGAGMTGYLENEMDEEHFLGLIKSLLNTACIKHSAKLHKPIKKVAICGGSGSFLIPDALRSGADIFISADIKYHQFFEADGKMMIADVGHYESEQLTKELIYNILVEKFPNFALRISNTDTNPVNYL